MDTKLIVLKLALDAVGTGSAIATVDDRKAVQKAVYLMQCAGLPLGYNYGWYVKGPYSTSLTKDYYSLAEELESGDETANGHVLHPALLEPIKRVMPLMKIPGDVRLRQDQWLELLASYHYLRTVSRYEKGRAVERLRLEKPHVVDYVDQAEDQLIKAGLLEPNVR